MAGTSALRGIASAFAASVLRLRPTDIVLLAAAGDAARMQPLRSGDYRMLRAVRANPVQPTSERPRRAGRPTVYSRAKADAILELMAQGESVRTACKKVGVADSTLRTWCEYDRDGIAARYTRAQEIQIMSMIDECLVIADDSSKDWIIKRGPTGREVVTFNSEHMRRVELKLAYRRWYAAQVFAGAMSQRRDEPDQTVDETIGSLRRLAAQT